MDGISIRAINSSDFRLLAPSISYPIRFTKLSLPRKSRNFLVLASKDEPRLNQWDQMELQFGKMLGEDPKLTLAKIVGRKLNPDLSNLEIEKLFYKKKGKGISYDIEEVPFDGSTKRQSSNSLDGLNLVRPVPKKGVKFEVDDKTKVSGIKRPSLPAVKAVDNTKDRVPDVILRKPSVFSEDDVGTGKQSRLKIQPNLSVNMGKEKAKERFSDMTLIRKPDPVSSNRDIKQESSGDPGAKVTNALEKKSINSESLSAEKSNNVELIERPEMLDIDREQEAPKDHTKSTTVKGATENRLESATSSTKMVNASKINPDQSVEKGNIPLLSDHEQQNDSVPGLQPIEQSNFGSAVKTSASIVAPESKLADSNPSMYLEVSLNKPGRLDQSVKGSSNALGEEMILASPESYDSAVELENLLTASPIKERENTDWTRAEDLVNTGGREEVELISSSTRGFVVSFGSLIGFLPYRNLAAKYKYLAFESWLRRKGLDPSVYKQNLSIIGSYEATSKDTTSNSSLDPQIDHKVDGEISSNMKLEDLLTIYDQEKLNFLSSFVGQKFKVNVILADRKSRRLIFSVKPKEKEELVERKRKLMAKLNIGDVVKCCIKKITYFGIFVEVEGVPALIHQTEVSWDATLDPESYFKIGQVVEAKVHQLDFSLERIFLSLKEIVPDPLIEALEAVIGDHESLGGELAAAEADTKWVNVEMLIKELNQYKGIQSVSRGRYFLSPGLAPTFQVYMASMFENQYKLLARAGNKVQEVIVETTLSKEEMKSAILTCTNKVE